MNNHTGPMVNQFKKWCTCSWSNFFNFMDWVAYWWGMVVHLLVLSSPWLVCNNSHLWKGDLAIRRGSSSEIIFVTLTNMRVCHPITFFFFGILVLTIAHISGHFLHLNHLIKVKTLMGSGCGSVGREVASDTRGPLFESRHRQYFIMNIITFNCWKDENKDKRGRNGNGPIS